MDLAGALRHVLTGYAEARAAPFAGHPMANFLRDDFAQAIEAAIPDPDSYKVIGSPGKGNWARGAWGAILDPTITSTAQDGYYPVYLFREDLRGVYLSLNQGKTVVQARYKADAKRVLKARAEDFRLQLGSIPAPFNAEPVDLASSGPQENTAFYEAGNICSRYYAASAIPSAEELERDLRAMVLLYGRLDLNQDAAPVSAADDETPTSFSNEEDLRKYRYHRRLERNRGLAREAKRRLGYVCQACGFDFEKTYGDIGLEYIEAHHLVPISSLQGRVLKLDPARDFAALCSNCHRMIHRTADTSDVAGLRARITARRS